MEVILMAAIPPFLLKKLYVRGSLRSVGDGFALDLTNPIAPGTIVAFQGLDLDGEPVPLGSVSVLAEGGAERPVGEITQDSPLAFPQGVTFSLAVQGTSLESGAHELAIKVVVQDVGPLKIPVSDSSD
jgi:hypothetical protein